MKMRVFCFILLVTQTIYGQSIDSLNSSFWKSVEINNVKNTILFGEKLIKSNAETLLSDSTYNIILEETMLAYINDRNLVKAERISEMYAEHSRSSKSFGKSPLELGKALYYQGIISAMKYDFDNSITKIREAIKIYESIETGDPHYILDFVIQAKFNLGNILEKQQKYEEALLLFKELKIHYEIIDVDSISLIGVYNYLTKINNEIGRYNSALHYAKKVLEISEKIYGPGSKQVIESYNNLGQVHLSIGNYNEAMMYNKLALESIEVNLGKESLWYATSLANFAAVYEIIGEEDKAYKLDSISSNLIFKLADPSSYLYLKSCLKMGSKIPPNGDVNRPIEYLNIGLKLVRETFEPGSQMEIEMLRELSYLQALKDDSKLAVKNARLAVSYSKNLHSKNEEFTSLYYQSLSNLGSVYAFNGEMEKALENKFEVLDYYANNMGD
jgi:tetratricopeptide (TPR) repeat protein